MTIKTEVMSDEHSDHIQEHLSEMVKHSHQAALCLREGGMDNEVGSLIMMLSLGVLMANKTVCQISDEDLLNYLKAQMELSTSEVSVRH